MRRGNLCVGKTIEGTAENEAVLKLAKEKKIWDFDGMLTFRTEGRTKVQPQMKLFLEKKYSSR
jgi:hypothetical protein